MSNNHYSFTPKQKWILLLAAGLLWLSGISVLIAFNRLTILSFAVVSMALIGCSTYTVKINGWANVGIIIIGMLWIGLSYLEQSSPIGATWVREWWLLGMAAILVSIYWFVQRGLAGSQD